MNTVSARNILPQLWKPLLIAAALFFVYTTTLVRLGWTWWDDPNYSHGLLAPLIIAYMLWTLRDQLAATAVRPQTLVGGAGIFLSLMMAWAGVAGAELFMQRVSLLLMIASIVIYFWGASILRLVLVPLLLLALAIPIPAIIFNKIAFPLQLFASRCAVEAMRLFDIPVLRDGNVIELMPRGALITKKLEVVEACSGIRSLMTLVTLAVVFAYFTHPRPTSRGGGGGFSFLRDFATWRSLLIVLSAIPFAIITNALRVSGTGVLAHYYGTEVADGFFHSFSGWIVYVLAFLLLFGFASILDGGMKLLRGGKKITDAARKTDSVQKLGDAPATLRPEPTSGVE